MTAQAKQQEQRILVDTRNPALAVSLCCCECEGDAAVFYNGKAEMDAHAERFPMHTHITLLRELREGERV
jgi:hypothetical protein